MSQEIPSPALQDTEPGEEKTAGPFTYAEYVASNMGIERADENISADKIRRDTLLFYRIVEEMVVASRISKEVSLHKLRTYLQKDSSNVNAKSDFDTTALHTAVVYGLVEVIKELVMYGADVTAENKDKTQPLHLATYRGNGVIVELLLESGADLEAQQETGRRPLHVASWLGHTELVLLLLSQGAKVAVDDGDGRTPLFLACSGGSETIVHHLLGCDKSNIDQRDKKLGYPPLIQSVTNGHKEIASILIKAGAKVGCTDDEGWNALHHATWQGYTELVSLLVKEMVDPNSQNEDGCTALHFAMMYNHEAVIPELLAYGARVEACDKDNWTPLHYAARFSDAAAASMLLDIKDEIIEYRDKGGLTALHIASKQGNVGVLKLLLDRGAIVNAMGEDSSTALHLASDARVWYRGYGSEGDYETDDEDDGILSTLSLSSMPRPLVY